MGFDFDELEEADPADEVLAEDAGEELPVTDDQSIGHGTKLLESPHPEKPTRRYALVDPVYLEVVPTRKNGTRRAAAKPPIPELEKRMLAALPKAESQEKFMKQIKSDVSDMLYYAWDRANRRRVIVFLASLLQKSVQASERSDLAIYLCWELCMISWASSLQDVQCYDTDKGPVVLLCGFGGSHIDDIRAPAERWVTHYGAAAILMGPCVNGQADQLDVAYDKLMRLLAGGRRLIVHWFSDGGFNTARQLLARWVQGRSKAPDDTPSLELLCCIVSDSASLGNGETGLIRDGVPMPGYEDWHRDPRSKPMLKQGMLGFFTGCGMNMLKHVGACNQIFEEPANSFAKAMPFCFDSDYVMEEVKKIPSARFAEVVEVFRTTPILVIASENDAVVPMERSKLLADQFEAIPHRAESLAARFPAGDLGVLGESGLGVHRLWFDKSVHAKHFVTREKEYCEALDSFVPFCLMRTVATSS